MRLSARPHRPSALRRAARPGPGASAATRAVMLGTTGARPGPFVGKSDIPRLGLGMAALGRPGYINLGHGGDVADTSPGAMEAQAHAVLDEAYGLGVRYFDCARSYGMAEEFVFSWLRKRRIEPSDIAIGSKWGYTYTAGWKVDTGGEAHEVKEHSVVNLRKQAAETVQALGPFVDVHQIHSATMASGVLADEEVLGELAAMRDEKGWRVGLSVSGTEQPEVVRLAAGLRTGKGRRLFDCVQCTFNLLEDSAGEALAEAHTAGMDVIIKEAAANGRLTARNGDPAFEERMGVLKEAAARHNCGVDALALACAMAQPFRPVVLSGAATVEQLRSNWDAVRVAREMGPTEVAALFEMVRMEPGEYWSQRAGLAWN